MADTATGATLPQPSRGGWRILALLAPAYGWLLLTVFLPLCAMLVFSFLKTTPFGSRQPLVFTFKNYLAFVDRPYLVNVAWTSLQLGLWTTGLCAALGLPAAIALARATRGRTRQVLFLLTILPFWTNGLVRVFSWTMLLREGGLLDQAVHLVWPGAGSLSLLYSFPAVVIGLVHAYLPYMILTCYLSVVGIEDGLIDAARSLGARTPAVFTTVILPLCLPGLVSGAILIFVPVIGAFMEPRILGGRIGVTMGTVIEDQFTSAYNWPLGAALSFTMLAAVLVIFAAFSGVLRKRLAVA
ncbi:ABC transporter permease [Lichenifustis flavocetrariae]|uniref:ABC transporter permease n=1 Tax=Lichenifustis flavocetrariae TaxID=2949735 RepID=A0AA41YZ42_9HYPH|nr:ABC transporter permease [Lichenifustis flavocetrariae]MCW6509956.1 ABC transporter permease [Lichenifustis flavocetrariae]